MSSVVMLKSLAIITQRIQQLYGSQRFYNTIRDWLPIMKAVIVQLQQRIRTPTDSYMRDSD